MKWFRFALFALVLGCVSRTLPEARFAQSQTLAGGQLNVVPADPDKLNFVAVGDLHVKGGDVSRLSRILDGATAAGDDLVVLLGDIVDTGEISDVEAVWQTIRDKGWDGRVAAVIGNHDIFHGGWEPWTANAGPSHYTFTVGNQNFIVLDTADGTLGETQTQWLEEQLASFPNGRRFLLSHYLPVVPGVRTYLRLSDEQEALRVRAIAHRYGVSAWLGGHYHSYVTGIVDGVRYVVAGGGGGRRMPPVLNYFYVRVKVNGEEVTTEMVPIPW